ncbi:MAG: class I SAM-dependent methyltransferase [Elusimicrobiota bacterium]|jgi:methionine biosynthesis protein MetW
MRQTVERASQPLKYDRPAGLALNEGYPWAADKQALAWIPESSRVLELGCSTGYMGRYLVQTKKCSVVGVEQDAASAARAQAYEKVIVGDLDDPAVLESLPGSFDVIVCLSILEHLNDPLDVLRRLKTKLEPQGKLIIALPNIAHWSIRWNLLLGRFHYQPTGILDETHLRFFNSRTARELVMKAGYIVQAFSIDPDMGIPFLQPIIRRIPVIGWPLLWKAYNVFPNLFGYQILIQAGIP